MELFKREEQHKPPTMLADVVRLYALSYGLTYAKASMAIRFDLKGMRGLIVIPSFATVGFANEVRHDGHR